MSLADPQWVYVKDGTIIPLPDYPDNVPAGVTPMYRADFTFFDSKDAYDQSQANAKIQGAANKARFDAAPDQYPACTNDPPMGPESQCGNENCDLHNILWLEFDGCTHEPAIGLTAVYNRSEDWGHGAVADALGGMDEFNKLNEEGANIPGIIAWYNAHQPLVQYFLESHDRDLLDYWWASKVPGYHIHRYVEWSMLVRLDENQAWAPYQLDGYPLVFTSDDTPDVSKADPTYNRTDYWLTHHWANIRFDVNPGY